MSASTSISATWAPLENANPSICSATCASRPGFSPAGRAKPVAAPASWEAISPNPMDIPGTPFTWTRPPETSRSASAASSKFAATRLALSRTSSAADLAEEPAVTVWRLDAAPIPYGIADVSPITTSISSVSMPRD